jgi:hypothetical protein
MRSALVEQSSNGVPRRLPNEKFYVPGSVLRASVDNTLPIAYGLSRNVDFFYQNNPVFHLLPEAGMKNVRPIAWFSGTDHLRSGWAWGQRYLDDTVAAVEAPIGKGKAYLFGPEITFRSQPHGTFKFLFNGIYCAAATEVTLPGDLR